MGWKANVNLCILCAKSIHKISYNVNEIFTLYCIFDSFVILQFVSNSCVFYYYCKVHAYYLMYRIPTYVIRAWHNLEHLLYAL